MFSFRMHLIKLIACIMVQNIGNYLSINMKSGFTSIQKVEVRLEGKQLPVTFILIFLINCAND